MSDAEAERLELQRQERAASLERSATWRFVVGSILCFTLIGIPFGLAFAYSGWKRRREAKQLRSK